MGGFVSGAGLAPDLALTSPAVRAQRTLELAARAGRWGCPVLVRPGLYGGGVEEVLDEIRAVPVDVRSLVVVGHEPVLSATACELSGAVDIALPTAAMLRLALGIGRWSDLERRTARIDWLVVPRLLEPRSLEG
jgi:phosphohistidine phosphatase